MELSAHGLRKAILFANAHVIVINKFQGLAVQDDSKNSPTLVNRLHLLRDLSEFAA